MTWRATAGALALSAFTLTACGGNRVDRTNLETTIAQFIERQTGTRVAVRCPDGVKADRGTRVRCTTVLSGAPTDIDIVFGEHGHFRITDTHVHAGV